MGLNLRAYVPLLLLTVFPGDTSAQDRVGVPSPGAVRIIFVGDVMLDRHPGEVVAAGGDPFKKTAAILEGADIVVANLECVVATGGQRVEKHFTFRADPRCLPLLAKHVDAVSLANNHTCDFGKPALVEMLGRIEAADCTASGPVVTRPPRTRLWCCGAKVCGSHCWRTTASIPAKPRPAPARPGSPGSKSGGQSRTSAQPAPTPTW